MLQRLTLRRRTIAILVALMGFANIASSLIVRVMVRQRIVRTLLPLELTYSSRHLAVVAGLALLGVSRGLWRGKRWTWGLTIALLLASAVFHLIKGLDWEEAGAALMIALLLLWHRNDFRAQPDRPTITRAFVALELSIIGLIVYVLVGGLLLRYQFAPPLRLDTLLSEVLARLALSVGPLQPRSVRALWFLESISVIGVALVIYLLGAFLRPIVAAPAVATERERAQELLRRFGSSSLSYFALLPDKSLYFGRNVEGVIAFRVAGEVAVVCGDPVVAPHCLHDLLVEFQRYCVDRGWEICFYETQAAQLHIYESLGFRTLKIGEDAWIDLPNFTLKGKPIADVRHAVSKIERDGLSFKLLDDTASEDGAALWQQMYAIATDQNRGDFELQFSIGRLPPTPDPDARYAVALGPDRRAVLAFCAWLPMYAVNGWALDVMQRHPSAPNGTMEYLIAQSLLCLQQTGAAWASLGVAPLADAAVDSEDERSLLQHGVRLLYEHPRVNELYRYKSLFFFKRKFVPVWRSVYLVYGSHLALPGILYAVLKVHLPVVGPGLITDFLLAQGERNLQRWRDWLRSRGSAREAEKQQISSD